MHLTLTISINIRISYLISCST